MNKQPPTSALQSRASQYALSALDSGYVNPQDLIGIHCGIIKSISGQPTALSRSPAKSLTLLKRHFKSIANCHQHDAINHNSQVFAEALNLPPRAWKFISLIAVLEANTGLAEFVRQIMPHDSSAANMLAAMAGLDENSLDSIMVALNQTGIFEPCCINMLDFITLPRALVDRLVGSKVDCYTELIEPIMHFKGPSVLKLKDFAYLEPDTLYRFLNVTVNESAIGINVLFYGAPGTGKTQLSMVLADILGASLIAIKSLGDNINEREPAFGSRTSSSNLRLQYHQLIQHLISPHDKNLLLVDECENIFEQGISARGNGKDTLHSLLETNAIPTIWITNHIDLVPESCIRRFSYVLNVTVPDNRILEQLMDKEFKGLRVSRSFKARLATQANLVPAHISNASMVAHCITATTKAAEHTIENLITATLEASGHETTTATYRPQLPFSVDYLNIKGGNQAIGQLQHAIEHQSDIRTLLLGFSGTGKTAVVHHLAKVTNRGLTTIRCSDVLDKYIGESEKNLARIFKEATANNHILFFDEIDSLLLDRTGLRNSWEIQQVNELLTQLEAFNQPFFAATNYATRLDKAVMRRFDFKLSFEYLTANQVQRLYKSVTARSTLTHAVSSALNKLQNLTPGEFAILARRQRISSTKLSDEECLDILSTENNRKITTKAIGFIQ
ncbi:AAA family ATPase [Shewanella benthica]|uniref:ATPase, AAA family protein n=1 Tax=Shewanella benthica KT99 TaxID=314608 RepID=A9CZR2_9GAMM|nr:AAA family ATPase [Shewanella benthica]EDQ02031.1 ATPase, AAA family protein [Shewanella benthica KT99]